MGTILPNQQSPMQEIQERVAESAPGLAVAVHMSAINDWRHDMQSYRRRIANDHAIQNKALGGEATVVAEEPMGNLIVTGDIYGNDSDRIVNALAGGGAAPAAPTSPAVPITTTPASPSVPATTTPAVAPASGFSWAKAGLISAAILAGTGLWAGIPWLAGAYDQSGSSSSSSTTINNPSDEQGLGIEVVPGGALR